MIKIIFLDIDGVLNCENYYTEHFKNFGTGPKWDKFGEHFYYKNIENLKILIEKTGAEIVISAGARVKGLDEMKKMWKYRGLPGKIIDVTPSFALESSKIPRGVEIEKWLNGKDFSYYDCPWQTYKESIEKSGIKSHVILDDDIDMFCYQSPYFVQTSRKSGFNKKCLQKAIKILNR